MKDKSNQNTERKKIFMSGVGGMLGAAFHEVFERDFTLNCTDKDVNAEWLRYLDFCDRKEYKRQVVDFNPNYLFHIGALTDLEYCEKNIEEAYTTNTLAVEDAVQIANDLDIPLLYISTAGIFDGQKQTYDDWDQPNPISVYARSKYMGERYVVENARRFLVCRAGWMMGGGPTKDKKFIQKIMKQLKAGSKELFIVDDKDGTPTYTMDFAENVKILIEEELWGLYNLVCSGETSRLGVVKELLEIVNLSNQVKIVTVSSDHFKNEYFVDRPNSEKLINRKLELRRKNKMRKWQAALREYIGEYYYNYL